jgi:micrococcal nuclease
MTPPSKFTYPISNIRIIDGDTIEADVDLGFRIRQRQIIRLAGIDAPELRSKDAGERMAAKSASNALTWILKASQPAKVLMHSVDLDKYGRSLAVLWVGEPWQNANEWMAENGYTTPTEEKRK